MLAGSDDWAPSRAQAVADGVLIDCTADAKRAGFLCPVGVTRAAWAAVVTSTAFELDCGFWPGARLAHLFDVMRAKIKAASPCCYCFEMWLAVPRPGNLTSLHRLEVIASPGDAGEFVLTVALSDE